MLKLVCTILHDVLILLCIVDVGYCAHQSGKSNDWITARKYVREGMCALLLLIYLYTRKG